MASRQLPEGWNHQARDGRIKGETGKSQTIRTAADPCHGVEVTADVQQIWFGGCFRKMAQPEGTLFLGGLLRKALNPAVTVMISADQHNLAVTQLVQAAQGVAKGRREPFAAMDEVTKNNELAGLPDMAKLQQGIESAVISVAGQRDSVSLKGFGLAEMQIRNHQLTSNRTPEGFLWEKTQRLLPPGPVKATHQRAWTEFCSPDCIGTTDPCITLPTPAGSIVTRPSRPNQLPIETLRWLERRLHSLERQGRYECAYSLRMEVAEWLLGDMDANLAVPAPL